jgi:hypothetical protein
VGAIASDGRWAVVVANPGRPAAGVSGLAQRGAASADFTQSRPSSTMR